MPRLADMPELDIDLYFYWNAFHVLSKSRQSSGFGLSPLAFQDILFYCQYLEVETTEETERFLYLIQVMDDAFLQAMHAKNTPVKKPS